MSKQMRLAIYTGSLLFFSLNTFAISAPGTAPVTPMTMPNQPITGGTGIITPGNSVNNGIGNGGLNNPLIENLSPNIPSTSSPVTGTATSISTYSTVPTATNPLSNTNTDSSMNTTVNQ